MQYGLVAQWLLGGEEQPAGGRLRIIEFEILLSPTCGRSKKNKVSWSDTVHAVSQSKELMMSASCSSRSIGAY
jgi:hypothetical protein